MLKARTVFAVILFVTSVASNFGAAEYTDGRIKLVIDEKLGRFSLYYMNDVEKRTYEPLFWDKDKRTSFLSAYINGKEYKLGNSSEFKMIIRGEKNKPSLVFESAFMSIAQDFSFIRTASSGVSNGVRIDVRLESWSPQTVEAGARLLIDTHLGEKTAPPFRTDLRPIGSETLIDRTSPDQYWVSRNGSYGLMGSIFVEGTETPDFLQFANWKRMNGARFRINYVQGRNFNATPFSVKDSAVCYFLDIRPMNRWDRRMMTVLLAAEDDYGFEGEKLPDEREYPQPIIVDSSVLIQTVNQPQPVVVPSGGGAAASSSSSSGGVSVVTQAPTAAAPVESRKSPQPLLPLGAMRVDVMTLRELMYKVDEYIYSGIMPTEEELKGMEATIARLKARYGSVFNTF
ncbi:MAG: hypothetical protein LBJ86_04525 [Spirochaetaceae bacterium]|jgi:hypothetical protein|nr:hypothetical protein [Spirochaetaceae bacterium]